MKELKEPIYKVGQDMTYEVEDAMVWTTKVLKVVPPDESCYGSWEYWGLEEDGTFSFAFGKDLIL